VSKKPKDAGVAGFGDEGKEEFSIAKILNLGVAQADKVRTHYGYAIAELEKAKVALPDMAPVFDKQIAVLKAQLAELDAAATPEGITSLAITVAGELAAVPKVGLKGGFRSGDVTGG
jgi:hypothetical protein